MKGNGNGSVSRRIYNNFSYPVLFRETNDLIFKGKIYGMDSFDPTQTRTIYAHMKVVFHSVFMGALSRRHKSRNRGYPLMSHNDSCFIYEVRLHLREALYQTDEHIDRKEIGIHSLRFF